MLQAEWLTKAVLSCAKERALQKETHAVFRIGHDFASTDLSKSAVSLISEKGKNGLSELLRYSIGASLSEQLCILEGMAASRTLKEVSNTTTFSRISFQTILAC